MWEGRAADVTPNQIYLLGMKSTQFMKSWKSTYQPNISQKTQSDSASINQNRGEMNTRTQLQNQQLTPIRFPKENTPNPNQKPKWKTHESWNNRINHLKEKPNKQNTHKNQSRKPILSSQPWWVQ